MTSKASSAKRTRLNLYAWTLRKNALIIGIGTVLGLILRPGLLLAEWAEWHSRNSVYIGHNYYSAVGNGHILFTLLIGVMILLLFGINFHYLHKKSESDLFHALPLSRVQLMLTRFAATVTGLLIPTLLSGILETVAAWQMQSMEITVPGCLFTLCMQVVLILAASGMVLLFCVLTGSTFDLFTSLLVVNVGWVLIYALTNHLCNTYLFGYYSGWNGSLMYLFSPFARLILFFGDQPWSVQFDSWRSIGAVLPAMLFWLFYAVVMLGLSVLLIKKRKNEAAGKPYAYAAVRYVIQGVVSILSGFAVGMLFSMDDPDSFLFYLFALIGALLGSIIYGAIVSRGFKTVPKSLMTAGVCVVLLAGTVLTLKFDLIGFNTRIPDAEDVKSVKLYLDQTDRDIYFYREDVEFTSPEVIENTLAIHQAAIDMYKRSGDYLSYGTFAVEYTLSSGGTMRRHYNFFDNETALQNIVSSAEYLKIADPVLLYEENYGAENFDFAWVSIHRPDEITGHGYGTKYYRLEDCSADYLNAHKMDLAARETAEFSSKVLFELELHTEKEAADDYAELSIDVYESDAYLLALLQKQEVIAYYGNGKWGMRNHETEHIITHHEVDETLLEPEETPTHVLSDGAASLREFEANGGNITDFSHVEVEITDAQLLSQASTNRIRSSTYGLQSRMIEAYKKDLEALGEAYQNDPEIYAIHFAKGAADDITDSPLRLSVSDHCSHVIKLLTTEGLIAELNGEDFGYIQIM